VPLAQPKDRSGIDRHKTLRTNMQQWERERLMLRSLLTLLATILLLALASNTATAARVCIAGHFHYGGSELHPDRVHAEVSAVRAWRAVQAASHGAKAAANMYPASNQIQCQHAPGNAGWRCFVRGGPCHVT
jgi:hypothetical protein